MKVSQGWGSAQLSGVGHYVDVTGWTGAIQRTWGWGIDAGVSFNLPQFGAGDEITGHRRLYRACGVVLRHPGCDVG